MNVNKAWDIVPRPDGKNVVSSKWVYKSDGSIERFKARLVARRICSTVLSCSVCSSPDFPYTSMSSMKTITNLSK